MGGYEGMIFFFPGHCKRFLEKVLIVVLLKVAVAWKSCKADKLAASQENQED